MAKKIFLILGAILSSCIVYSNLQAQQVLTSAGLSGSNGSGSITSTLGELVINTGTDGNITLTQGFHQTKLTITAINDLPDQSWSITVFPNPANDWITIRENGELKNDTDFILLDLQGKILLKGILEHGETRIDFTSLAEGTYIINILKKGEAAKSFKVVKQ